MCVTSACTKGCLIARGKVPLPHSRLNIWLDYMLDVSYSYSTESTSAARQCSIGDSCSQWTLTDCPETIGGELKYQPTEQGNNDIRWQSGKQIYVGNSLNKGYLIKLVRFMEISCLP